VLFVDQSGTLLTVPFDAGRRRVTGSAEPVAENVATSLGAFARYSSSRGGAIVYFTGLATERRQLVLVDRAGRTEPVDVPAAAYRTPRFSPDGRRLAVGIESASRVIWGDIWDYSFASRRLTRLTFDESNSAPEWSPDGRFLTFVRSTTTTAVYRVAADGSTDPAPLFERRGNRIFEARLLPDGRHLVFREDVNVRDVLVAPVDSPAAARPLAATAFNERAPAMSPDGRWVAFVSNLSGPSEVYVRRLEDGSPRWKVSTSGGVAPRWGPGGRELFYRDADSVYVVAVRLGAEPQFGDPRALFGGQFVNSGNDIAWDVSPDGQRFAMVRPLGVSETTTLHLILHHFDHLASRRAANPRP
jgi:Tol biopolymer transport system component